MANINLLPWRDELRAEKQKQFYTVLVMVLILAAAAVFAWLTIINGQIDSQRQRNSMLQREISELDKKVNEIKDLKRQRADLIDRMTVIQNLQGNRPQIVRVFDDFVRKIPDGVYFKTMQRKGAQIRLEGVAESNNRVSSLMRQLDESDWLAKPNLLKVKKADKKKIKNNTLEDQAVPNEFEMTIQITAPESQTDEEDS